MTATKQSNVKTFLGEIKYDPPDNHYHLVERWDDWPTLDNLRLSERRDDSELHLLLHFIVGNGEQYIAGLQREVTFGGADEDLPELVPRNRMWEIPFRELTWRDAVRRHIRHRSKEQTMLIDVVKDMNDPRHLAPTASIWLDRVNGIYGSLPHSLYFPGRFGLVFCRVLENWEIRSGGWATLAGGYRNEMIGDVIEGAPEVLEGIPGDDWYDGRNIVGVIKPIDSISSIGIIPQSDSISTLLREAAPLGLKVKHVLFGPLYL